MRPLTFSVLIISTTAACALPAPVVTDAQRGQECWAVSTHSALLRAGAESDRQHASRACHSALERNTDNQTTSWYVPESRTLGTVTPVASYRIDKRTFCREYAVTIGVADGTSKRVGSATGTACRQDDGTWSAWPVAIPEDLRKSQSAANDGSL